MFKKNILIILLLLSIPFILVIFLVFNPIIFENSENIYLNTIPSKMFTIQDYEYLIFEEINKANLSSLYDIPMENYYIYPYTIIWKDTLSKIAHKFNLSKDEISVLVHINKIKNKDLIIAGEILLIPKKKK